MPYSEHFRIAIWIVVVAALRMIAKADPMIRRAMPGTQSIDRTTGQGPRPA
jgi:type IV secretory pathway TrbD component